MNLCSQFRTWLATTREFRRLAVAIAGEHYYNNHRHEIKNHIRNRTRAVLDGFDPGTQTARFHSDVLYLIQGSK